jgi:nicotinate phosphoribosyltransferase
MNSIEHGPLPLELSSGLDFYKPTMSQLAFERHPEERVTFTFHNRGNQRIADYVDTTRLQDKLNLLQQHGWTDYELAYLRSLQDSTSQPYFSDGYLSYLKESTMPPVQVCLDKDTNDIAIQATGDWPLVTFWETVVMGEVNEAYFEGYMVAHDVNPFEVYDEGDRRLSEKIAILQDNPGIKFSDFGNRRHFSLRWQKHIDERLMSECPDNFMGTSNISLARQLGITPIGTFAHEVPMVYAALADMNGADIRASHGTMLDDWFERYGKSLSIALTDTFGSDFFFADFGDERAAAWRALRHDSGDPVKFGEKVISFYEQHGIDPKTKTIVFSDGLDIETIVQLYEHFNDRVGVVFGWGTTLTNDLGLPALNIVMKATEVNGTSTVKLSDVQTKHTGNPNMIERYTNEFTPVRASSPASAA